MDVKKVAVGFAWFVAYFVAFKVVVQPAAARAGVPVVKDL